MYITCVIILMCIELIVDSSYMVLAGNFGWIFVLDTCIGVQNWQCPKLPASAIGYVSRSNRDSLIASCQVESNQC